MAAAFATASETPKIAFAPNLDLFSVPSKSIINLSIAFDPQHLGQLILE